jgi:hypothetical protein
MVTMFIRDDNGVGAAIEGKACACNVFKLQHAVDRVEISKITIITLDFMLFDLKFSKVDFTFIASSEVQ